ncbi:hypothetical protein L5515_018768 [Caenorhabditis briggsae]|uniref:Uncharacterized protein n=1 Tax=Caenorhabditis briggsae TaxID=6238 RepID=A0AAE9FK69_CAEBR|nr:hypothetical protein L5515_018768 [Caenorhabditis briggsae]
MDAEEYLRSEEEDTTPGSPITDMNELYQPDEEEEEQVEDQPEVNPVAENGPQPAENDVQIEGNVLPAPVRRLPVITQRNLVIVEDAPPVEQAPAAEIAAIPEEEKSPEKDPDEVAPEEDLAAPEPVFLVPTGQPRRLPRSSSVITQGNSAPVVVPSAQERQLRPIPQAAPKRAPEDDSGSSAKRYRANQVQEAPVAALGLSSSTSGTNQPEKNSSSAREVCDSRTQHTDPGERFPHGNDNFCRVKGCDCENTYQNQSSKQNAEEDELSRKKEVHFKARIRNVAQEKNPEEDNNVERRVQTQTQPYQRRIGIQGPRSFDFFNPDLLRGDIDNEKCSRSRPFQPSTYLHTSDSSHDYRPETRPRPMYEEYMKRRS